MAQHIAVSLLPSEKEPTGLPLDMQERLLPVPSGAAMEVEHPMIFGE